MTYDPDMFWGARAERHGADYVGPMGDPVATKKEARKFGRWLAKSLPQECGTLLDFGCGSGRFSELLAGRSRDYYGCDIVAKALDLARHAHPSLQYRGMRDMIPVGANEVDTLVATVVFQHIPADQWLTWCLEIKRVLTPGAEVVVIDNREGTASHMFPRGWQRIAGDLSLNVDIVGSIGSHDAFRGRFVG